MGGQREVLGRRIEAVAAAKLVQMELASLSALCLDSSSHLKANTFKKVEPSNINVLLPSFYISKQA